MDAIFDIKGLYLLTDPALYAGKDLFSIIKKAADSRGVNIVQYRDDTIPLKIFIKNAIALKHILSPYKIPLIIGNRIEAVIPSGANGLHLEDGYGQVTESRFLLGDDYIIGCSIHFRQEIEITNQLPLNYIAVGPIFKTSTKNYSHNEWGVSQLRKAVSHSIHPVVAVGGLNSNNISKLQNSGIRCVASVSEVLEKIDQSISFAMFVDAICKLIPLTK